MNEASPALCIDHLRGWIGREDIGLDIVGEDLARKYHATMDFPGEPPGRGEIAPQLIHFCLAQPAAPTAALGSDGHPSRGGFLPPVPLPRRMWAGGALTFHADLRVGDATRRISRIEDVVLKQGRSGTLCFVTVSHRLEANGALVLEERQDIVYRDATMPGSAAPTTPAREAGTHRRAKEAGAPMLFRYSALTFNGHRVHYDRPYASEVEGYPGLVVHGPLQAAWLCNYAAEIRGAPPKRFSFRGLSPLFDHDGFALHANEAEGGLALWTARQDGAICVSAQAHWG
ncbi:protein dehydratase [Bosea thiooxidans]|uniref:3-methylfumaryl-CoA hydratase n=1 Tax=Bosea thiooxidans TaxID=53254 RepID=A0A0Q3SZ64_9HYPH|nr:MaoC family dehydratase N-terminal domain-containing protein [Bosea thiooxidans]KQK30674.1 protein dehydratase [Bosea thiooxidans]SKC08974.1 3-methylfumaryl-CoA hydratase [Bosea thiooxidans]